MACKTIFGTLLLLFCSASAATQDEPPSCASMADASKVKECFSFIDADISSKKVRNASDLIKTAIDAVTSRYEDAERGTQEWENARVLKSYLMYFSGRVAYISGQVSEAIELFQHGVELLDGTKDYATVYVMNSSNIFRLYAELDEVAPRASLLERNNNYFKSMLVAPGNITAGFARYMLLYYADSRDCTGAGGTATEIKKFAHERGVDGVKYLYFSNSSDALVDHACGNFPAAAEKTLRLIRSIESAGDLSGPLDSIMYANMSRYARESGDDVMARDMLRKAWAIALRFSSDDYCLIRSGLAKRAAMQNTRLIPCIPKEQ